MHQISLMEGDKTTLEVECGIEEDQLMHASVPILASQRDSSEEVRRDQREWRPRPLSMDVGHDRIEIVLQGGEGRVGRISVAEANVPTVIVSQDSKSGIGKGVGNGHITLLRRPVSRAKQDQGGLCRCGMARPVMR